MTFTNYELIQIENAFDTVMDYIEDGELSLEDAVIEASFIHDLSLDQITALHKCIIILSRK